VVIPLPVSSTLDCAAALVVDIIKRVVVFPWKLVGYTLSREQAGGSHRGDEGLESRRVGIQRPKVIPAQPSSTQPASSRKGAK
jgi:hypothetical protein